ncbi:MAG: hypothetical protein IJT94_18095 [Oscillibacter sp.]|nr:hypothetical protein [Oscillibacter sp.]
MSVTGAVYEETIFYWLTTELELNSAAACGVMANLYAESGFRPDNLQGSYEKSLGFTDESYTEAVDSGTYENFIRDQAGYGLCQWTYWSRKEGLLNLARTRGTSVGDLLTQLEYLRAELSSRYAPYAAALSALRSVPDTAEGAYEAASVFCVKYEQPANTEAAAGVRGNLARDTYFAEYGPPPADDPEDAGPPVEAVHSGGAVTVTVRDGTAYEAVYCAVYGADGQFLSFASDDVEPDMDNVTAETKTPADAGAEPGAETETGGGAGTEDNTGGEIEPVKVYTFLFEEVPFHSAKIVLTDGNRIPLYAVESQG